MHMHYDQTSPLLTLTAWEWVSDLYFSQVPKTLYKHNDRFYSGSKINKMELGEGEEEIPFLFGYSFSIIYS